MTAPGSEGAATPPTSIFALSPPPSPNQFPANRRQSYQASATAFVVLFCIVGVSLDALSSDVRERAEQTRRGSRLRVLRRMGCGPLRASSHDDRHTNGRDRL